MVVLFIQRRSYFNYRSASDVAWRQGLLYNVTLGIRLYVLVSTCDNDMIPSSVVIYPSAGGLQVCLCLPLCTCEELVLWSKHDCLTLWAVHHSRQYLHCVICLFNQSYHRVMFLDIPVGPFFTVYLSSSNCVVFVKKVGCHDSPLLPILSHSHKAVTSTLIPVCLITWPFDCAGILTSTFLTSQDNAGITALST